MFLMPLDQWLGLMVGFVVGTLLWLSIEHTLLTLMARDCRSVAKRTDHGVPPPPENVKMKKGMG